MANTLSRLTFETLFPGTDEVVISAVIPNESLMAVGPMPRGTLLTSHPLIDLQGTANYSDFILNGYDAMQGTAGQFVRANFTRDYTAVNPATGLLWNQSPIVTPQKRLGDHPWPAILRAVRAIPDYSTMRQSRWTDGTNIGVQLRPSYNVYADVVERQVEGTLFVEEDYLSNEPFEVPQTKTPITRTVVLPLPGGERFVFRDCLCDTIRIDPFPTGQSVIYDTGTITTGNGGIPGQVIPATNFITWKPYIKEASTSRMAGGVYGLHVVWVYPPKMPEPITILQ